MFELISSTLPEDLIYTIILVHIFRSHQTIDTNRGDEKEEEFEAGDLISKFPFDLNVRRSFAPVTSGDFSLVLANCPSSSTSMNQTRYLFGSDASICVSVAS